VLVAPREFAGGGARMRPEKAAPSQERDLIDFWTEDFQVE